ncbi:MAG: hypothetical protein J6S48_03215 [Bacteroidales bacterium]|nr:hypothetical protein [Bacteroidales bacterium]
MIICVALHILAFGQIAMPFLAPSTKKTLGIILFSLAKAFQYSGLAIVGVEGYKQLKKRISKQKEIPPMPKKRRRRKRKRQLRRRRQRGASRQANRRQNRRAGTPK